jgi:hypothetical protein
MISDLVISSSLQAITGQDLESLHRYVMARYDIQSYEEYIHVLALCRNTRAIEAQNARQRYTELSEASALIERARLAVMCRLQNRYSNR